MRRRLGPRNRVTVRMTAALAAAVAAAAWWLAAGGGVDTPASGERAARDVVADGTASEVGDLAPRAGESQVQPVLPIQVPDVSEPAPADPRCTWHGRLLWPDGASAPDVAWDLSARSPSQATRRISGATGSDGRFDVAFDDRDGLCVWLEFELSGGPRLLFRDDAPFAARDVDLGDIRLNPAFTLRGSIVDEAGRPLGAAWDVSVSGEGRRVGTRPWHTRLAHTECDPVTGSFGGRVNRCGNMIRRRSGRSSWT